LRQVSGEVEVELLAAKELCEKLGSAKLGSIVSAISSDAAFVKLGLFCIKELVKFRSQTDIVEASSCKGVTPAIFFFMRARSLAPRVRAECSSTLGQIAR